jgi:hypothetical protein
MKIMPHGRSGQISGRVRHEVAKHVALKVKPAQTLVMLTSVYGKLTGKKIQ